jgi:cation diffusion facilitator CzcD-associated flavoprotein CzcO
MMRRIGVIGAGPGGICMGIQLKRAGYHDFVILEQAAGAGGTWWHNSYPGCACDVPSYLYSFSFEQKNDWSRPYAGQPEIRAYLERCVERYGLTPHLRLETRVEAACWDDEKAVWHLTSDRGETFTVDILVSAIGLFNLPAFPDIDGLDRFAGTLFHSARWNHEHDLTGARVAVIGSAASAVQFVPEIAKTVRQLDVYQRSPNWIFPRESSFAEGQLERFRTDPLAVQAERDEKWNLVNGTQTYSNPEMISFSTAVCLDNIAGVADPDTRRKLTPTYPFGCKRVLISSDWYPTFNRSNVTLITDPIGEITSAGVVTADGIERPIDTIVFATGFDTTRYLSAIEVAGRNRRRLSEAWSGDPQAYLGVTTSGFPNLFMLYGPNTNNGSIIFQIECQVAYALRQIRRMDEEHLAWIDIKPEIMESYNRQLQQDLDKMVWSTGGCHNYYRAPSGRIVTQWPHGMDTYRDRTSAPDPDAYDCAQQQARALAD